MGEPKPRVSCASSTDSSPVPSSSSSATPTAAFPSRSPEISGTLLQPSPQKKRKTKVFRVIRSVFRSFPIITPTACKIPVIPGGNLPDPHRISGGTKITGTLFGYRKGRVTLSIQETPKSLPTSVIEMAMQTNVLQKELSAGMVRIAMETEKRPERDNKIKILDEPLWTMFCNGKKIGYGLKKEATEEDLKVMELLRGVSMGAGVLPGNSETEGPDGEMAYMRAYFERVVGSRDSETFYMLSPDGNNGPELSIFFVRL